MCVMCVNWNRKWSRIKGEELARFDIPDEDNALRLLLKAKSLNQILTQTWQLDPLKSVYFNYGTSRKPYNALSILIIPLLK